MSAPAWTGEAVWLHTDLSPDNVIVRDGRTTRVIDVGLGVGDPAPDLIPAWHLFSGESREVFLDEVGYDAATQARGFAWLLAAALKGLIYYRDTRPDFIASAKRHVKLAVAALP